AAVPTAPAGYRQAGPLPPLMAAARGRFAADGVEGAMTVTGGALDGIQRALTGHAAPGDAVAIEDPCWANLRDLIVSLGMRPVPVPVDAHGPVPEDLDDALRHARAAVITSRAHNPTGAFITAERAAALRAVLSDHPDVVAIEDDHWAELSDDPLSPVADAARRWLFIRSVSKPYGPDLRCAAACGDDTTIARLQGRMRVGAGWVSTILQHLVLGVWNDPRTPEVLRAARDSYRRRRRGLLDALAVHDVPASGHTGLNVWIPVDDETTTVAALRDRGYAVSPGAGFRIDAPAAIRVTISGMSQNAAPAVAEAVAAARRASYPLA
ncbi:MAG TPA: aminotransferase class I/II-fold pyridoxal phosphate-dependent enzyme, partial [Stackebrandtia sp.]|uniref:aminotransferase class I/II-fold pyridoxal phosphate-dependent enzyme n=1 Tax=Stackebrandtia sp. TaxID=2023065 RepID=UPI002D46E5D4